MRRLAVQAATRVRFHQNGIAANMLASRQRSNHMRVLRADILVMKLSNELLSIFDVATRPEDLLLWFQGEHIRQRRKHEANAIIEGIPRALTSIKYFGQRIVAGRGNEYTAVGEHKLGCLLLVGIKFVISKNAHSNKDEAWVTTAHFIREAELRRLLRKGAVHPRHRNFSETRSVEGRLKDA
ncbi:MAG: hypothetical protein HY273_14930 [Gammaproteobacteria bacterium]|nr:hypothetical protein [Gammaproteobacteria bacterium]